MVSPHEREKKGTSKVEPEETERDENREVGPQELEPTPEHDKGERTKKAVEEGKEESGEGEGR